MMEEDGKKEDESQEGLKEDRILAAIVNALIFFFFSLLSCYSWQCTTV